MLKPRAPAWVRGGHPHIVEAHAQDEATHAYSIDKLHPSWPSDSNSAAS